MSPTTLRIFVIVRIVGLPVVIVGTILYAYAEEQPTSRRIIHTLLFSPFSVLSFLAFVWMTGAIILSADWGLGLGSPIRSEVVVYAFRWIVPVCVIASFVYLLITRPEDLKAQYPRRARTIDRLQVFVDVIREKFGGSTRGAAKDNNASDGRP